MKDILEWTKNLIDYDQVQVVKGGMSGASIYKLTEADHVYYLKIIKDDHLEELRSEVEIYDFLQGKLGVPRTKFICSYKGHSLHCFSQVKGQVFESCMKDLSDQAYLKAYGQALKALHQVDYKACPVDHHIKHRLKDAGYRLSLTDKDTPCHYYDYLAQEEKVMTKAAIYEHLKNDQPKVYEPCLTHGDFCFDNLIKDQDHMHYIDMGRGGIADKYQDLAIAVRQVHGDFGKACLEDFFNYYGLDQVDYDKINYYLLLDELF